MRAPSLPADWHLNHLHMAGDIGVEEAMKLADRHLPDLSYRHLEIEAGEPLEDRFRAAGWDVEREVVMVLRRTPEAPVDRSAVIESSAEQMLALMRHWIEEDEHPAPGALEQHVESVRRRALAAGERHFGIADSHGALVAMTNLRSDGRTAQVENVYTAPQARGRGYARTLVAHVTRCAVEADHELTFITADDLDWPKHLYARLGYEAVGRTSLIQLHL